MDARIVKTKNKLKDALFELLETEKINNITISKLCRKAGVNRNTFYVYYNGPEEVFQTALSEMLEKQLEIMNIDLYNHSGLINVCKYIKENCRKIRLVINRDINGGYLKSLISRTRQLLYNTLKKKKGDISIEESDLVNEYINCGAVSLIKRWLDSDTAETPEVIASMLARFSNAIIESYLSSGYC